MITDGRKDSFSLDIFGSLYNVNLNAKTGSISELNDGECDIARKEIHIRDMNGMEDKDPVLQKFRQKQVMEHEVTHAFAFETGFDELSNNETLIDWIALNARKLVALFDRAGEML